MLRKATHFPIWEGNISMIPVTGRTSPGMGYIAPAGGKTRNQMKGMKKDDEH